MTVIRWILALLIVAAVGAMTLGALKPRERPPTQVQTAKAGRATLTRTVSGAGKLEPASKVNVSSNITGVLLDLKAKVGTQVKKGDYLGQIDTSRYLSMVSQQRSQLAAARADVDRAKANLNKLRKETQRLAQLADRDAIGLSELEQATSGCAPPRPRCWRRRAAPRAPPRPCRRPPTTWSGPRSRRPSTARCCR